ncbi:MAG: YkgJ family cysteine cluster protein [Magnetococcales bacterium]|nr:YkgJ family cysteine cluster protein [Magnetococcales bacterium]
MSDSESKKRDEEERVETFDPKDQERYYMPREVRNILKPVYLSHKDEMQFRCYPGISCFNACCNNIEIILTPYDLIRLRRRLNKTVEEFLYEYANPGTLQKGQIPVAVMRMDEETGRCPFNTDEGCTVYEDRPVSCRYYPIGMAMMRKQDQGQEESFYFLIKEDFCKGHKESKRWRVEGWRDDQGAAAYDELNRGWMEMVLKRRSAGDMAKTSLQLTEMIYMASTNPDAFRRFVFESTFLQRYELDPKVEEALKHDDVALTRFAFEWLKAVIFGDRIDMKIRDGVLEESRGNLAKKAALLKKKEAARKRREQEEKEEF